MNPLIIREITPGDNHALAQLIHRTLEEFSVPETGTARADKSIDNMYSEYDVQGAYYLVAEENGKLIGGGGIAPLKGGGPGICELQKMYISPAARGKGLGKLFLKKCLNKAIELGYKGCYLETMPNMKTAQNLYEKYGFTYLDKPMGTTGHFACQVRMYKLL